MKSNMKTILAILILVMVTLTTLVPAFAAENDDTQGTAVSAENSSEEDGGITDKGMAAALVVGVAAAAGAIGMALAISKSVDSIARQPEAEGKIRTTMMLGLVFIETAIIYALVVAILIIFVL